MIVPEEEAGLRLDRYLTELFPDLSRARVQALIGEGEASVNGKPVKVSYKVQAGDDISLNVPPPTPARAVAQEIPLRIVYEDADLLVIDKPRGMATHPAPGSPDKTLVNALLAHCSDLSGIGGEERPGIVHRLDKDTTGLLVVAKNDLAHRNLQGQIQSREAKRRYLALVWGVPRFDEAEIDVPIGRHPNERIKMAVLPGAGREARTDVFVRERLGPLTLLECRLHTGRTHQIRVHCQYAGHPVAGDSVYGGRKKSGDSHLDTALEKLPAQALHAFSLAFNHPRTGEPLAFEAPLPAEMEAILSYLRVRQS